MARKTAKRQRRSRKHKKQRRNSRKQGGGLFDNFFKADEQTSNKSLISRFFGRTPAPVAPETPAVAPETPAVAPETPAVAPKNTTVYYCDIKEIYNKLRYMLSNEVIKLQDKTDKEFIKHNIFFYFANQTNWLDPTDEDDINKYLELAIQLKNELTEFYESKDKYGNECTNILDQVNDLLEMLNKLVTLNNKNWTVEMISDVFRTSNNINKWIEKYYLDTYQQVYQILLGFHLDPNDLVSNFAFITQPKYELLTNTDDIEFNTKVVDLYKLAIEHLSLYTTKNKKNNNNKNILQYFINWIEHYEYKQKLYGNSSA